MSELDQIKQAIRDVPDFPKKGIVFKDITPVLGDANLLAVTIRQLAGLADGLHIDAVCGIEARGFIFGSALARELNVGFVPVRKPGKLPYSVYTQSYDLEYGTDTIELHTDAFKPGAQVLLVDDLLATGGTAQAAIKLIEKCGAVVPLVAFLIELSFLEGRKKLDGYEVKSLISI